jgi:hypothetical membrane protein
MAAPVLLVGGWTLAEARQPPGYSPIRDTISALAARGATDRWVMTSALAGLGACYLITALGLRPARRAGRAVLCGGGAATILVAAFPQPAHGNSVSHTVAATLAFVSLAAWPVFATRPRPTTPLLTGSASTAATVALLGLLVWFAAEIHGGAPRTSGVVRGGDPRRRARTGGARRSRRRGAVAVGRGSDQPMLACRHSGGPGARTGADSG